MPELLEIFAIEASFRVPGLGILTLPAAPVPAWLAECALHTAWAITIFMEGRPSQSIFGTVEELAHEGQPPRRTLLLDFDPGFPLPNGSYLQAHATLPLLH